MYTEVFVTAATSVVLIDSSLLTPPIENAIVYLQHGSPGQIVTIRDSTGYLSTPQTIIVSTVGADPSNPNPVTFLDGTTSILITNPYGYVTVSSKDENTWTLANSFGFPQNKVIASVNNLSTTNLVTSYFVTSSVLTSSIQTDDLIVNSNLNCYGPVQYNTLVVGPPYQLVDGYTTTINGNINGGSATFTGNIAASNLSTGSMSVTRTITTRNLTIDGNLTAIQASINCLNGTVTSRSTISEVAILGDITVTNSTIIRGPLTATTANASAISTGSLSVTSQIDINGNTITPVSGTLVFTGGMISPSISTGTVSTSRLSTGNLYVNSSIIATDLQIMDLSSTQIVNPHGSLSIASIVADTLATSNLSTISMTTQALSASTITLLGNLDLAGYISIDSGIVNSVSTTTLYGQNIKAENFTVGSLAVNSVNITGTFTGANITTLDIPNALITASSILTTDLSASSLTTDQLYITGFISTGTTLNLEALNVLTNSVSTLNLITSTMYTSTLTANKITIGQPVDPAIRGPYWICTSSTNCVVSGNGDYFNPMILSNVKPPGYTSNTPYNVNARFKYFVPNPGNFVPGGLVDIQTSLFWANELTSASFMSAEYNPVFSLYGYYAEDLTSNLRSFAVNDITNPSAWIWDATMINDSRATVTMQSYSNINFSLANYDNYINMQNGVLKWNYALNDTTIQNSLNDISTRNLLYYGSLNFISDPRLKKNVESADLKRCHDIIRDIPLHRYAFKDAYVNTFGVTDIHRLGVMADEYEAFFPKSVTKQEVPGFSTVKTIDTQQLDMAHLGATQYLLKEVAALRSTVESLR